MANEQNLQPNTTLSKEEAKKLGRAGGIASGKVRKQKKLIKDSIEMVLGLDVKSSKMREQLKKLGIEDEDMNNQLALVVAMVQKGLKGDVQAFNTIRDTVGQKPIDRTEVTEVPKIVDDVK